MSTEEWSARAPEVIRNLLFPFNFVNEEDRSWWTTLDLPVWPHRLQISLGNGWFWVQLQNIMLLQAVINVGVALLVRRYVRNPADHKSKTAQSIQPYLWAYGVIIPILLVTPYLSIQWLQIENPALILASTAGPVLLVLRCMESLYGTTPEFAMANGRTFLLYYCSTVQFSIDPKSKTVVPMTMSSFRSKAFKFVRLFFLVGLLHSLLMHRNFAILSAPSETAEPMYTIKTFLVHIVNTYFLAWLTSLSLETGSTGLGILASLCSGYDTIELNDHPLTRSTSPSDFWGQRWNRLVSSGLKRAVHVPMRIRNYRRTTAAVGTFVASGLVHEYIVFILESSRSALLHSNRDISYYGSHLAFFTWNGLVLWLEPWLSSMGLVQRTAQKLPRLLRSWLVILTVLPIAHWFTDLYVANGLYYGLTFGFPLLRIAE